MKKLTAVIVCLLVLAVCAFAVADVIINETNFPDANFREYVKQFDTDGNGSFSSGELAAVISVYVNSRSITSLKGIEYFTALQELKCSGNQLGTLDVSKNTDLLILECAVSRLTELNVSKNTNLQRLVCTTNSLTELDVSHNTGLQELECGNNKLSALDVTGNAQLKILDCGHNSLTELDLSNNINLEKLYCAKTQITKLDISRNTKLTSLFCYWNPYLTALDVSRNTGLQVMGVEGNQLSALILGTQNNLVKLDCSENQLSSLNISRCPRLLEIADGVQPYTYTSDGKSYYGWCDDVNSSWPKVYLFIDKGLKVITSATEGIAIDEINFPDGIFREYVRRFDKNGDMMLSDDELAAVTSIDVDGCQISSLTGIEYFTALKKLKCRENRLTALDISNNTQLKELDCNENQLTELNVGNNTQLTEIFCAHNQLTELDLSHNTQLTDVFCPDNLLTSLDLSHNPYVVELNCWDNRLTRLVVAGCGKLIGLFCSNNQLTELDVGSNLWLEGLDCADNLLTELDVSTNRKLEAIQCENNRLTAIKLGIHNKMERLLCYGNQLTTLDISNCPQLLDIVEGRDPAPYTLEGKSYYGWRENNGYSWCNIHIAIDKGVKVIWTYGVAINEKNFPDETFREYVRQFDTNENGYLSDGELSVVTSIDVEGRQISSLTGIQYFTELQLLVCSNNQLNALYLKNNTKLRELYCQSNKLYTLSLLYSPDLQVVQCDNNKISTLTVTKNKELLELSCSGNNLTVLNVRKNKKLQKLDCSDNRLHSLDVSKNTNLQTLYCDSNQLTELNVVKNKKLKKLTVSDNQLSMLNVSKNTKLVLLDCHRNQLTALTLGKLNSLTKLVCSGNNLNSLDIRKCSQLMKIVKGVEPSKIIKNYYGWRDSGTSRMPKSYLFIDEGLVVITSKPVSVTSVKLNKTQADLSVTLTKKGTVQLKATVSPKNATNKNVSWMSSDTGVANVDETGLVTAVGYGSCEITATAKDGSKKKAVCSITVTEDEIRDDTLVYSLDHDKLTAKLTASFTKKIIKAIIPATVKANGKTYKVTSIGKAAFKDHRKITWLKIGKNVTVIEAEAFSGCTGLKDITLLSENLSRIEAGAFKNLPKKVRLHLDSNLKAKYIVKIIKLLLNSGIGKIVKVFN